MHPKKGCAFVAFFVFETKMICGIGPVELGTNRLKVEGGIYRPGVSAAFQAKCLRKATASVVRL